MSLCDWWGKPTLPHHVEPWLHSTDCTPVHLVKQVPHRESPWTLSPRNITQNKNSYMFSPRFMALTVEYLLLCLCFPLSHAPVLPCRAPGRARRGDSSGQSVPDVLSRYVPNRNSQAAFSWPTEQKRYWNHCCHGVFLVADMAIKHLSLWQTGVSHVHLFSSGFWDNIGLSIPGQKSLDSFHYLQSHQTLRCVLFRHT